jgi:hypothetical protein
VGFTEEDPNNVYGLVTDDNLSAASGQTRPGTGGDSAVFAISGQGSNEVRESSMAHEIAGHGPDVLAGTFNDWWKVSIGAASDPQTGERNNAERGEGLYLGKTGFLQKCMVLRKRKR